MNDNSKKISIFDLDGTLTKTDTYLPYLIGFLKRNPRRWLKAIILPFAVVMFYLKIRNNEWLKTIFLQSQHYFLRQVFSFYLLDKQHKLYQHNP